MQSRLISAVSEKNLSDRGNQYVDRMHRAATRMKRMLLAVLEFSTVGQDANPAKPVSLQTAVEELAADLEVQLNEAGATLHVDTPHRVEVETTQLRRSLQNLLTNAIRYARPEVPPVIRVSSSAVGDMVQLTVADNGQGFDGNMSERIFEPFQKGAHNHPDSSGIGLAVVRRVAELHGGEAWAEGKVGEGATFHLTFPAAVAQEDAA